MRIGIDARMYGPKQGGLGRYIQQLIAHLEQLETTDEFIIFLRKENWDEYTPKNNNFKKVLADIPWYGWQEQIKLSKIIKQEKVDLMHFPHWNVPLFYNDPFIVTIHDLLLLHYPTRKASTLGPFAYWFKNFVYKIVLRHAATKSKHILTISEFTRKDIVKNLGIAMGKITVAYLAPFTNSQFSILNFQSNLNFQNTNKNLQSQIFNLKSYGITKPYALYVGVAYPHKNLEGLIEAWRIFTEKYGTDYQLVLVGKNNYFYNRLKSSILNLKSSIILTNFIEDDNLSELYKKASLFIMPSHYEGFALPPLEAMSYGIPVASSNATCLPEVLGSAALYFDPRNENEMAEAIHEALTNANLREFLKIESQKILLRYNWKKVAEKTYALYQKMV